MNKEFLFMEEGSIEYTHLRKFLDKSGFTDGNIIQYKKGTPKPEIISVEVSEPATTLNPEVYRQEAREELLKSLYEFLVCSTERYSHDEYDYMSMEHRVEYTTKYRGTISEFMDKFKNYIEK